MGYDRPPCLHTPRTRCAPRTTPGIGEKQVKHEPSRQTTRHILSRGGRRDIPSASDTKQNRYITGTKLPLPNLRGPGQAAVATVFFHLSRTSHKYINMTATCDTYDACATIHANNSQAPASRDLPRELERCSPSARRKSCACRSAYTAASRFPGEQPIVADKGAKGRAELGGRPNT